MAKDGAPANRSWAFDFEHARMQRAFATVMYEQARRRLLGRCRSTLPRNPFRGSPERITIEAIHQRASIAPHRDEPAVSEDAEMLGQRCERAIQLSVEFRRPKVASRKVFDSFAADAMRDGAEDVLSAEGSAHGCIFKQKCNYCQAIELLADSYRSRR